MKYKLLDTSRGVIVDPTPILQDVKDTFEVSFLLLDSGAYIALFRGADGAEYRKAVKDGVCKIPRELLTKEQYVEVTVCKIDNDKVLQSWDCEPLKVTAFLHMRKNQWQLSAGMTDDNCLKRLAEIEELCANTIMRAEAENKALKDEIAKLRESIAEMLTTLASVQKAVGELENGKFKLMSFKGGN